MTSRDYLCGFNKVVCCALRHERGLFVLTVIIPMMCSSVVHPSDVIIPVM